MKAVPSPTRKVSLVAALMEREISWANYSTVDVSADWKEYTLVFKVPGEGERGYQIPTCANSGSA